MDPPNLEWEPNDLIGFDSVDAPEGLSGSLPHAQSSARTCPREILRRGIAMSDVVKEFSIEVPEADLNELRERLKRTRWPERETVED
jgi:hypothetical protein